MKKENGVSKTLEHNVSLSLALPKAAPKKEWYYVPFLIGMAIVVTAFCFVPHVPTLVAAMFK